VNKINPNILTILVSQIICAGILSTGIPEEETIIQVLSISVYLLLLAISAIALFFIIFEKRKPYENI